MFGTRGSLAIDDFLDWRSIGVFFPKTGIGRLSVSPVFITSGSTLYRYGDREYEIIIIIGLPL